MKTIIYLLIAVMLGSIIYSAIPAKPKTISVYKQQLVLESKKNLSEKELSISADIISKRLEFYGIRMFNIFPNFEKSQIEMHFKNEQNLLEIFDLLTQIGKLEISETGNRKEILSRINQSDSIYNYLQIDPISDQNANSPEIGKCKPAIAEKLGRYLNSGLFQVKIPLNNYFAWSKIYYSDKKELILYYLKSSSNNRPLLDSMAVTEAKVQKEGSDNYSLYLGFSPEIATKWQLATKANINRALAILIDHYVYFAPVVRDEMKSGNCVISGSFTQNELKNLASIIKFGELPSEFRIK